MPRAVLLLCFARAFRRRPAPRRVPAVRRPLSGGPGDEPWFTPFHRAQVPSLDDAAWARLEAAARCLLDWNSKINVVSRKGMDPPTLVERHYLPSLALLEVPGFRRRLEAGASVIDVGTGGGFPGLPLAISCPAAPFVLVDSVGKKLSVVRACAEAASASNVRTLHAKVPEELNRTTFDFVLGRAVTSLPDFIAQVAPALAPGEKDAVAQGGVDPLANGVLYVKGGDFDEEISALKLKPSAEWDITDLLGEAAASSDKCVLYFSAADVDRIPKRSVKEIRAAKSKKGRRAAAS